MGRTPALHWVEGGIAHKSTRWCSFHTGTWFPIRALTCSRAGPWGFQRERWWLPVPCISCGGYIQASATWHFWSVGLSALLSNPDPQLCWLMVTVGASGVCTRCLTLHLAAVLCHGKCPLSSKAGILSGACMASFSQPAPKWGSVCSNERLLYSAIFSQAGCFQEFHSLKSNKTMFKFNFVYKI